MLFFVVFGFDVLFTIDYLRGMITFFFFFNAHHDFLIKEYISYWFLVLDSSSTLRDLSTPYFAFQIDPL